MKTTLSFLFQKAADILKKDPYGHLVKQHNLDTRMDLGFLHAFVASLSMVIVSELGDKTFFIAAIMAMRHSRLTVFLGAIGALALMTVLSGMYSHRHSDIGRASLVFILRGVTRFTPLLARLVQ